MAQHQNYGMQGLGRFLVGKPQPPMLYAPLHYEEPSDLALSDNEGPDSPTQGNSKAAKPQSARQNRKSKAPEKEYGNAVVEDTPKFPDEGNEITVVEPLAPRRQRRVRIEDRNDNDEDYEKNVDKDDDSESKDDDKDDGNDSEKHADPPIARNLSRLRQRRAAVRTSPRLRSGQGFSAAEMRYMVFMSAYKGMTTREIAQAGTFEFGRAAWTAGAVGARLRTSGRDPALRAYRALVCAAHDAARVPAVRTDLKDEMKAWLRRIGKNWAPGREEGPLPLNDTPRRELD